MRVTVAMRTATRPRSPNLNPSTACSFPLRGETGAVTDSALLEADWPPRPLENLGRAGVVPPRAPNTAFAYLCAAPDGSRQLRRLVVHGACTRLHEERILRALSRGRYFLRAVAAGVAGDDAAGAQAMACCELVSITPSIAAASDDRDVEAVVAQLEAAALYGWSGRLLP